MKLFIDTETTGKILNYRITDVSQVNNFPRLVQLGFIVVEGKDQLFEHEAIIKPEDFEIPVEASNVHGITTERALAEGVCLADELANLLFWIDECEAIVGHNVSFDLGVLGAEYWRRIQKNPFAGKKSTCTMISSTNFCAIPSPFRTQRFKYPKLCELYQKLFGREMGAAHTALQDISNTVDCYLALVERGVIKEN